MTENNENRDIKGWRRNSSPLNVWKILNGTKNGQPAKFTIQEVPEDRFEDVLNHMIEYFLAEEAGAVSLKLKDDPLGIEDNKKMWAMALEQGISIAMFTDNPNGGKPILVGANILMVISEESMENLVELMENFKSPTFVKGMMALKQITDEVDLKSVLGTDECLFAFGLSVLPSFRGQAFGKEMLSVRKDICLKYGLKATTTVFTSPISVKLAERSGFEVLLERNYDEILDEENKPVFPNCKSKQLKYMYRKFE